MRKYSIQDYRANPLGLLHQGVLKVESAFRIQRDGSYKELLVPDLVPFRPRWEQRVVIELRQIMNKKGRPCNVNVAKARDVGLSVVVTNICVAESLAAPRGRVLSVSVDPGTRNTVVYPMIRTALVTLPDGIRPILDRCSKEYIEWRHRKDSELADGVGFFDLRSAMLESRTGVGQRVSHIWLTEYAKFDKAEEVLRGLGETQMPGTSFRVKESTCEGPHNLHFREWKHCWDLQGECNYYEDRFKWDASGANEIALFFPWFHSPARICEFLPSVTESQFEADLIEYERDALHEHMIPFLKNKAVRKYLEFKSYADCKSYALRQLYWHRSYCVMLPEWNFANRNIPLVSINKQTPNMVSKRKEAPLTWQEAFADDGMVVFPSSTISILRENQSPSLVGILGPDGRFLEDPTGWFKCWYTPEELKANDGYAPPEIVFLGTDFAHGDNPDQENTDFSATVGFRRPRAPEQCLEVELRCTLPEWEGRMALVLRFLTRNGNPRLTPYLCPECTGPGRNTVQRWADEAMFIETGRLYYSQLVDRDGRPYTNKAGFEAASGKLNLASWSNFESMVLKNEPVFRSQRLIDQIACLKRMPKGTLQAASKGKSGAGSKDDVVDAAKMALWHIAQVMEECGGDLSLANPYATADGKIQNWQRPQDMETYDPERVKALAEERRKQGQGLWDSFGTTNTTPDYRFF